MPVESTSLVALDLYPSCKNRLGLPLGSTLVQRIKSRDFSQWFVRRYSRCPPRRRTRSRVAVVVVVVVVVVLPPSLPAARGPRPIVREEQEGEHPDQASEREARRAPGLPGGPYATEVAASSVRFAMRSAAWRSAAADDEGRQQHVAASGAAYGGGGRWPGDSRR